MITLHDPRNFDSFIKGLDAHLKIGLIKVLSFRCGFGHRKEVRYRFLGMDDVITVVLD